MFVLIVTLLWVLLSGQSPQAPVQSTAQVKAKAPEIWPTEVREVSYRSSADNSSQPALFYSPDGTQKRPLLVALHTWSSNYRQTMSVPYARWCIAKGWVFIHPHFRGPNFNPHATGSEMVIKDILDAVEYTQRFANVDKSRIYLVGASGGGYTALLMAGRAPKIWAGVSAWVPISDLQTWYYEMQRPGRKTERGVAESCGGIPSPGSMAEKECLKRSPLTYLAHAKDVPIDINAGINDGHTGSVPISHSLRAFNMLAAVKDQVSEAEIEFFVNEAKVPTHLQNPKLTEMYGQKKILFRRQSQSARVTIFDGGHEIVVEAALKWLSAQRKNP
jgi:dipeptidyl aminopeptidase/acylaminoacyl peptidase